MTNVQHVVFLYAGYTNVDADDIHDGVSDAVDWDAWAPGVSSMRRGEEDEGVTVTIISRLMKNTRGEMTRAMSVNVSYENGAPDINTKVYEW